MHLMLSSKQRRQANGESDRMRRLAQQAFARKGEERARVRALSPYQPERLSNIW